MEKMDTFENKKNQPIIDLLFIYLLFILKFFVAAFFFNSFPRLPEGGAESLACFWCMAANEKGLCCGL